MNNIDYLKVQTISSLSSVLKFDDIKQEIIETFDDVKLGENIRYLKF